MDGLCLFLAYSLLLGTFAYYSVDSAAIFPCPIIPVVLFLLLAVLIHITSTALHHYHFHGDRSTFLYVQNIIHTIRTIPSICITRYSIIAIAVLVPFTSLLAISYFFQGFVCVVPTYSYYSACLHYAS
jgi:hypothetical protein